MDLRADLAKRVRIAPGDRALIATGLYLAIPKGYEGQVRPRSGLALKSGITIPNAPGTVDADYRGEVKVILQNSSNTTVEINDGDRIAQLVFATVATVTFVPQKSLEELGNTERSAGGFGSTGK